MQLLFDIILNKFIEFKLHETKEFKKRFELESYVDGNIIKKYDIKKICLFIKNDKQHWINLFREFLIDYVNKYSSTQTTLDIEEALENDFSISIDGEDVFLFKDAKIIECCYTTTPHKWVEYAMTIIESDFGLFAINHINRIYTETMYIEDVGNNYKIYDVEKKLITKYEYDIKTY